jgi:predicted phosphodiesterase
MRVAVVSDIHGNRTAFDAVLADLRLMSPDVILHGGDLADGGSDPAGIIDQIRDLGWEGVLGNTDESHTRPESLEEFAKQSQAPPSLWEAIREMTAWTRDRLGEDRIAWMRGLPLVRRSEGIAVLHASLSDCWRAPEVADFESAYKPLGAAVVFGHTHRSLIHAVGAMTVVNAGSVSLSYDGDARASYVLIEDGRPVIRRVDYDMEREIAALIVAGMPQADWMIRTLRSAAPQMP